MKKVLYIFLFIAASGFAQPKFNRVAEIEIAVDFFTTDNQSNVYVVSGDQLIKYDKAGKQLCKYSNKNLGKISYVDASNMLKILVFYGEFSQVIFLDNTLSINGEPISFDKLGFQQAQLACVSHNNGMWVYDQQNFSLTQLSLTNEKVHQTTNINNSVEVELQPTGMIEYNNNVYLNNPASGILIFDIYGTYYKTIPIKNLKKFQPTGDWVYFKENSTLKAYNIKTTEEQQFTLPLSDFIDLDRKSTRLNSSHSDRSRMPSSA